MVAFDSLYHVCAGGAVVIRYLANDDSEEDGVASGERDTIERICEVAKRHRNQVLTIFLDNARKYTPAGGHVVLGAHLHPDGVRFFVRDDGIGMDEETCRHAFDRFHQAEKSHSGKGSGLGLAIAREVMQKMGIPIHLTSAPNAGSEFSFILPVSQ